MIVAIDGPAGSGKSTTARRVAERLGYVYLDTGAMYRAGALRLMRSGEAVDSERAGSIVRESRIAVAFVEGEMRVLLDGVDVTREIRAPEVGSVASRVSKLAPVREGLVQLQREIANSFLQQGTGVVLDGRDIGTVVFPDAQVKIFMIADPMVRAQRRQAELSLIGRHMKLETVLLEIQQRDRQDTERAVAPLRKAEDAYLLDTTRASMKEQEDFIVERVWERASETTVKPSSYPSPGAGTD
ncbi:MAG TPA: (d)CMP kinase [Rhodothermales bacterium]|nr:(d)CMP kinase [Rhodothermales bacterium]